MRALATLLVLNWTVGQSGPASLAQTASQPDSAAIQPLGQRATNASPAVVGTRTQEAASQVPPLFEFFDGDRVVLLGDALIEREQLYGYVETRLLARYPKRKIVFRNLGWSADNPAGQSRVSFDWHKPEEEWTEQLLAQIAAVKPTVAILGYGMASSFDGEEGLGKFKADLAKLIERIQRLSREKPIRFVLLGPIRHEELPAPLPNPTQHNRLLALYAKAIQETAEAGRHRFISLFELLEDGTKTDPPVPLTDNGIHLNAIGYWRLAEIIEMGLGWNPTTWRLGITKDGKLRRGSNLIQVEELEKKDDSVRFKAAADFLEVCLPPGDDSVIPRRTPPNLLQFAGLKPGTYVLKIDGHALAGLDHTEWAKAQRISGGPPQSRTEQLRQTVIKKNELFFHRWRPQNQTYLFGFRKNEQGQNAREIPMFDPLIEELEDKIAELVKPLQHTFELVRLENQPSAQKASETVGQASSLPVRGASSPRVSSGKMPPEPADKMSAPHFEIANGFEIELFAENPQLAKPIQINFDPQGRLWVASSSVYPQIQPGQVADDKILVLEDTDGDGKSDKSTVFTDGLLIPTGVEPGDGGAYVGQSTELLHFKDLDGDGKADQKRVVLSGFGTEDTHHILHTLRWGPDGQLYFNQSIYIHSHIETPHGVVRLNSGGIFHLRPPTLELGIHCKGWVNSWGHDFDAFGQSFVTDGAGSAGINYGVPGAMYLTYAGAGRILESVSPGNYPKFCSLEIVASQHFPDAWQGSLITCDFRAHRVVRFAINEQGSGYVTREMPDLLRTSDVAFRPVDVKFGPDGALYIADWSNPIIQHGEVDFRDPRRDHEHGRIWRITAKGRPLVARPKLDRAGNAELLDQLLSPNAFNQRQARRVLTERGPAIVPDLAAWTKENSGNAGESSSLPIEGASLPGGSNSKVKPQPPDHLPAPRPQRVLLEALRMYQSIDVAEPDVLERALSANDGRIRAAAVRVVGSWHHRLNRPLDLLARAIGGVGGKVGPDMTSLGASAQIDYLIESLHYPNRKVKEGYHSTILETKDGQEFSGVLVRENREEVVVRDATDKEIPIPKSQIEKRATGGSIMPSGLLEVLDSDQQIDLYRFLSELGKPGPFDASKGNVARFWKLFAATIDAAQFGDERILKSHWTDRDWSPAFARVDGRLPREELESKLKSVAGRGPSAVYAAARFQISKTGQVHLNLSAQSYLGLWIDSRPNAATSPIHMDLSSGTHTFVIKLDAQNLPDHVRIETDDGTFLTE
ncbi:MAG: hypothetical protein HY735_23485 [Verrucomicrobia bacterium]|nr:hypothetical protein [Verrucomicrobiota bacterium]